MRKTIQKGLSFLLITVLLFSAGLNIGVQPVHAIPPGPGVTTNPTTEITETTVKLYGTVTNATYQTGNPGFFYWTHIDGVTEHPLNATGIAAQYVYPNFSTVLSTLQPNTQYDYQACVSMGAVLACGNIGSFTTLPGQVIQHIIDLTIPDQINVPNLTDKADLVLPATMEVTFDDNTKGNFPVEWDLSNYDQGGSNGWTFKESGGYRIIEGTLTLPSDGSVEYAPNTYLTPRVTIFVDYPNLTSIPAVQTITAPLGTSLAEVLGLLPNELTMTFSNGQEASPPVTWDEGTPTFTGEAGTYTFIGTPGCFQQDFARKTTDDFSTMGGGGDCGYYNPNALTAQVKVKISAYAWQLVGPAGFTAAAHGLSFAYDATGTPFVAFADGNNGDRLSVMKFDGTSWVYAGSPGLSDHPVATASMAFHSDEDGALYIAYTEQDSNNIVVSTLDGKGWKNLNPTQAAVTASGTLSLGFAYGVPIVAFPDAAQAGSASVIRYTNGVWEYAGIAGFSGGAVQSITLSESYNSLYTVSYIQAGELNTAYLTYPDQWVIQTQSGTAIELLSQVTDHNRQAYVAYQDFTGVQVKAIDSYEGWNSYGLGGISESPVQLLALTFDGNNVPYIAFTDTTNAGKVTVKKLKDNTWQKVGAAAFTAGSASELKIQVINSVPHVAIVDNAQNGKLTVLNFRSFDPVSVQTANATNITTTSAAVGGTALGTVTVRGIEYGTQADLSGETFRLEASAEGSEPFTVSLTGLQPGTTYYVRAYAVTPVGIVYGDLMHFTTSVVVIPDVVVTNPPTPAKTVKVIVTNTSNGGTANTPVTQLIGSTLTTVGKLYTTSGIAINVGEITIKPDGSFLLPNVPAGTYTLALNVIAPNGERLAGQLATLTVDASGNATISAELIDPYGIITDSVTGKPVDGVNVTLHWSDTVLNRSKGRTPDQLIVLPELPDFAPNKNHDPQTSTDGGRFGWMVYPEGDYYILGEKAGYVAFDSRKDTATAQFGTDSYIREGNIHVGQTIVEYNFKITPAGEYKAYMKGYPDGSFQPKKGVTRAEIAAILSRTMTTSQKVAGNTTFKDISSGYWAAADIKNAAQQGWLQGTGNHLFQPEQEVTRAEMAQLLFNVYAWTPSSNSATVQTFSDVQGHWAQAAITAAVSQELFTGYTDGTFHPNQPISRAETVTLINKLLKRPTAADQAVVWSDVPTSYWAYGDIMAASVNRVIK
ncbi:S-layer homology domain-containing protein [Paenibacillus monticola]|uniref:SLH domain-containing protein n=1 Tax=Paenibacillus monticola TaxID=2666075 RepID=A0A7X2H337_9BACL|nr:S-layer homology domain-containing protein [Paenibacillus monticola]MRN52667.1 hypothetical protein [Paenibacillus monticola]